MDVRSAAFFDKISLLSFEVPKIGVFDKALFICPRRFSVFDSETRALLHLPQAECSSTHASSKSGYSLCFLFDSAFFSAAHSRPCLKRGKKTQGKLLEGGRVLHSACGRLKTADVSKLKIELFEKAVTNKGRFRHDSRPRPSSNGIDRRLTRRIKHLHKVKVKFVQLVSHNKASQLAKGLLLLLYRLRNGTL